MDSQTSMGRNVVKGRMEKMAVPLVEDRGVQSKLSGHFGRAPFLGVIDLEGDTVKGMKITPNTSAHFGGKGKAAVNILKHNPTVVVVLSCGPGAIQNFQQREIAVLTGAVKTLQEAIDAFLRDELFELTEGCRDHRHEHPHTGEESSES